MSLLLLVCTAACSNVRFHVLSEPADCKWRLGFGILCGTAGSKKSSLSVYLDLTCIHPQGLFAS